jgi:hypothetical protein
MVDESVYKKYTARVVAAYPGRWRQIYSDSIIESDGQKREGRFDERVKHDDAKAGL